MPKVYTVTPGAEIRIGNLGTATNTVGVEVTSEKVIRQLGPEFRVERPEAPASFGDPFRRGRRSQKE